VRLKLLAPVSTPDFALRAPMIQQRPGAYGRAWAEATRDARETPPDLAPDALPASVTELRFVHDPACCDPPGSRYQSIERHSLARPLHAVELELSPRGSAAGHVVEEAFRRARSALDEETDARSLPLIESLASALRHRAEEGELTALVRVFDHGVSLLEIDLPLPEELQAAPPDRIPDALDHLQRASIFFVETLANVVAGTIVPALTRWLGDERAIGELFLEPSARERHDIDLEETRATAALWVTRAIIVEPHDPIASPDEPERRARIFSHWLKDVPPPGKKESEASGGASIARTDARVDTAPDAVSIRWLNYLFAEASYEHPYPAAGWTRDRAGVAQPFCPSWDAMLIAQYYYAAFDLLQSLASRILAIAVSRDVNRGVDEIKRLLDTAIRNSNMLSVEFHENAKYYARRVAERVDDILDDWAFHERLLRQTKDRIEDCGQRLAELHSRGIERSGFYTDIILVAITIAAIFEMLLFLADYGRTMSSDAELATYDQSTWNIADWIASRSTDSVLLAAAVLTLGLIALYVLFRRLGSRL